MQKSKSLKKMLMVGGATIALLAPLALSPIANNVVPNTTITVQAKRRHHKHHRRHSSRFYIRRDGHDAKIVSGRAYRKIKRSGERYIKHVKAHKIRELRSHIRHSHSIRRSILKWHLRMLRHESTHTMWGRYKILTMGTYVSY